MTDDTIPYQHMSIFIFSPLLHDHTNGFLHYTVSPILIIIFLHPLNVHLNHHSYQQIL